MIFSPALRVIKIERILILKALIGSEILHLFFLIRLDLSKFMLKSRSVTQIY